MIEFLSSAAGAAYILPLKASIAHGIRPSALILGTDSRKPWGKWDILLANAYQGFLAELCPQCGMPEYMCHTDDPVIQFKIKEDSCAVKANIETHEQKAQKSGKDSKGVVLRPQHYMMDGTDASRLRQPYFEHLSSLRASTSD